MELPRLGDRAKWKLAGGTGHVGRRQDHCQLRVPKWVELRSKQLS